MLPTPGPLTHPTRELTMPAEVLTTLLSRPQLQVLQILPAPPSGHTVSSAAHACGIPERAVRDWMRVPALGAALLEGQAQLLQKTRALLAVAAAEAVKALV